MLKQQIEQFLTEKRVAFVGGSRQPGKFGNTVYKQLRKSGYDLHPIHPEADSIEGDACVRSVRELPGDVHALMAIARLRVIASVLSEVPESNISSLWVFWGPDKHPEIEAELDRLRASGVSVISGYCPCMFIEPVGSFHALHRFFARLLGKYPK